MRTTVRLPDDLYRRAKARAAESGVTFTQLLEDALRLVLARTDTAGEEAAPYEVRPLPAGDGLQAGVDLHDQAALLDVMEGR
ncbi:MAG: ribbon-helix-helix protein, CopG family [Actinomycetes bacterium]